jgi:hypothetical protein
MPAGGYRQFYGGGGQNLHQPTPAVIFRGATGTPTNQGGKPGESAAAGATGAPKVAPKKREFKGLKIVNPDTKEEVKVPKPAPKVVPAPTVAPVAVATPAAGTPGSARRERKPIAIVNPNAPATKDGEVSAPVKGTEPPTKTAVAAPSKPKADEPKKETMADRLKKAAANPTKAPTPTPAPAPAPAPTPAPAKVAAVAEKPKAVEPVAVKKPAPASIAPGQWGSGPGITAEKVVKPPSAPKAAAEEEPFKGVPTPAEGQWTPTSQSGNKCYNVEFFKAFRTLCKAPPVDPGLPEDLEKLQAPPRSVG